MTFRTFSLFALAGLTGFALQMVAAPAAASGGDVISITANTQAQVDDLRIAAYNIRDEPFKDDKGADATRLSAALQLSVKNDPSQEQKLRVHAGQTFAAGGKSFEVTAVEPRLVKLTVK